MKSNNAGSRDVSIWPVLFKTYGPRLSLGILLGIVMYLLQLVNPVILNILLDFIKSQEMQLWKGFFFLGILFLCNLVWTISGHMYLFQLVVVSLQMRSSVMSVIYRKALKLSNKARSEYTGRLNSENFSFKIPIFIYLFSVGEITNYISVDAQRIMETVPFIPNALLSPIFIVTAWYLLYQELGFSAFGGMIALVILIPINVWGTKKCEELETKQLEVFLEIHYETSYGLQN